MLKFRVERLVIDKYHASGVAVKKRLHYNATICLKYHGIFQFTIALISTGSTYQLEDPMTGSKANETNPKYYGLPVDRCIS